MIYSATNHWEEACDAIWRRSDVIRNFADTSPRFQDVTDITCFSFRVNNVKIHINGSITVKTVGGISLCNAGDLVESEGDTITFSPFSLR